MSTILVIFSPRSRDTTGIAIGDTIKVLKLLNFRTILLICHKSSVHAVKSIAPSTLFGGVRFFGVTLSGVINKPSSGLFASGLEFLIEQVVIAVSILRLARNVKDVVFSHCLMPLPMLLAHILNKSVLVYVGGPLIPGNPKSGLSRKIISILSSIYYGLAKAILVVTPSLRTDPMLVKYIEKIYYAPVRILDEEFFRKFSYSPPSRRENLVGFVSRLSWEKGIVDFVRSIPLILSKRNDVTFLIRGDGPSKDMVVNQIMSSEAKNHVSIIPWIDKIETCLKRMKLLILPSSSEGLPSVVLEAMACGTPVLVTPVPGLKGLLEDGKNAFLLSDTNMEYLAQRVLEVVQRSDLDDISRNAYQSLLDYYSTDQIVNTWKHVLKTVSRQLN